LLKYEFIFKLKPSVSSNAPKLALCETQHVLIKHNFASISFVKPSQDLVKPNHLFNEVCCGTASPSCCERLYHCFVAGQHSAFHCYSSNLKVWQTEACDVDGCIALVSPATLKPRMALMHNSVPVLALWGVLEDDGWAATFSGTLHDKDSGKLMDVRDAVSKRAYFQCLLKLETLLGQEVTNFKSGLANGYYMLMLKTGAQAPPNLKAIEYKQRLAALTMGPAQGLPAWLEDNIKKPLRKKRAIADAACAGDSDDDNEIACDDGIVAQVVIQNAAAVQALAIANAEDLLADDEIEGDGGDGGHGDAPLDNIPKVVYGHPCRFIKGKHDGGWNYHDRLSVVCRLHANCSMSRSIALDVEVFGADAAQQYLGTWLHMADQMPAERHKSFKPCRADIRLFLDTIS
jgi:hypothetical protein